jgi:hypothetical protein
MIGTSLLTEDWQGILVEYFGEYRISADRVIPRRIPSLLTVILVQDFFTEIELPF